MNGRVIGVNTWIASTTGGSIGLGFAIPAELVNTVTNTLIEEGKVTRGWLGVSIRSVDEDLADAIGLKDSKGAIVASVTPGSPAEDSGLQRGDIIVAVNDRTVDDATTTTRVVGALAAGSKNKFEIYRDGKPRTIDVRVGERPANLTATGFAPRSDADPSEGEEGPLGVSLRPLNSDDRERLNLSNRETGMLITALESDSPLADVNIRPGMAILDVNNKKLDRLSVLEQEIEEARENGRSGLLLAVHSEQGTTFVTIDLDEDE